MDLNSALAKITATTYSIKMQNKFPNLGSNPSRNDLLMEMLHEMYYQEYEVFPEMGTDYTDLAFQNTSAGLIAMDLDLFHKEIDSDVILYLSFRSGGSIELFPNGPYITFRDFLTVSHDVLD